MAQFKSDTFTAQETAAGNAGKLIDTAELISGKSAFFQAKVTVPAGTVGDDTILLGYIPSGMTIIPGLSTVQVLISAGDEIDIGYEGAPAAFAGSQDLSAAQVTLLTDPQVASHTFPERTPLIATLGGGLTAGGVFYVNVFLVNSN